jgi:2-dehydro-3-deoxy-D-arabinonate dehydratase
MYLTRHATADGARWAADGEYLPAELDLGLLLQVPSAALADHVRALPRGGRAAGALLAPLEPFHEVWAAGVTYLRSREARKAESAVKELYARVYEAPRPELFWKSLGWRVAGHGMPIRVRADSAWNVPEPELTLVVNSSREIVGFCAGNDVSSRDIEGENPLYLPQAKVYDGSCALGPGILLVASAGKSTGELDDLPIKLAIARGGQTVVSGETRTSQIKRPLQELVDYLGKELAFPRGVFLMTGTGIVPGNDFSLAAGDAVRITVGALTLENEVAAS